MTRRAIVLLLAAAFVAPLVAAQEVCCCERPPVVQTLADACCEPSSACVMAELHCAPALETPALPAQPTASPHGFAQPAGRDLHPYTLAPSLNAVALVPVRHLSPPSTLILRSLSLRL